MNDPNRNPSKQANRPVAPTPDALAGCLTRLYRESVDAGGDDYLQLHATPNAIRRQVEAFLFYWPWLPESGKVLDWGCRQAPDACLVRACRGPEVKLFGCDRYDDDAWRAFHEFASLHYQALEHPYRLPYEDGMFDLVISAGVLEHAVMDMESLKELHRTLRDDGILAITFLPNRYSLSDWVQRLVGTPHHLRLYSKHEIKYLLLHHGFEPIVIKHHQFVPTHRWQHVFGRLEWLNGTLESIWPFRLLSTNLLVVARRRRWIS